MVGAAIVRSAGQLVGYATSELLTVGGGWVFQARRRRSARSPVGDVVRRSARPAGGRPTVMYEHCRCEAGYMEQQVGGPEGQQLVRYSRVIGAVARNAADDGWGGHAVSARVGGLDVASWPVGGTRRRHQHRWQRCHLFRRTRRSGPRRRSVAWSSELPTPRARRSRCARARWRSYSSL